MADEFASVHPKDLTGVIVKAVAVTPSDAETIDTTRAIYVGTLGDIVVTMPTGSDVTFSECQGWMPIRVTAVKATGTTATNIVACY